jgi:hypothetical protein
MDISKLTGADKTAIAKLSGISVANIDLLIMLATTYKIPQAEIKFKNSVGKLSKAGKRPFVFVREAKGSYFFVDMNFPMMKKDLIPKQSEIKKLLAKAKEAEKPGYEAYLCFVETLLDRVKKKKMIATYGAMKLHKTEGKKCFMNLAGKIQGADKANLHTLINPMNLMSKPGDFLQFVDPSQVAPDTDGEETTTTGEETTTTGDGTSDTTAPGMGESSPRVQQLQNALKQLQGKLGEWQKEQDNNRKANMVKPLLNAADTLLSHITNFMNGQEGTAEDKDVVSQMGQTVQNYKAKLAQVNAKVMDQKGVATVNKMNEFFAQIKQDSQLLKDQHGEELAGLGGDDDLVGILDQLLSA